MDEIKISIIMPVYNAEKYLKNAIKSVLVQSEKRFELILINDGSTDKSAEICDSFSKIDERVKVIHQNNKGICASRNKGLDVAKGEYIMFIDNDDEISPDTLQTNLFLAERWNADWVKFGKKEILLYDEKIIKTVITTFEESVYSHNAIIENLLRFRYEGMMTFVWDSLMSKRIIQDNHIRFDVKFQYGNEDIDFCERYAKYSNKLVVNDKLYYYHYTRIGYSTSSKFFEGKIDSYLYLLNKSNKRYLEYNIPYENNFYYSYFITKQIIMNVCQKINDAGKKMKYVDKIREMNRIWNDESLFSYISNSKSVLKKVPIKIYIYNRFFVNRQFGLLLILDKCSRKIVYKMRMR